jgi:hypothetical protein
MAGLGRKTFTAGDVLTASQVQGYLQDQTLMVFAGTAARSSAIASPSEGMFTITTDNDQIDYYNGSSWVPALPIGAWTSYVPTFTNWAVGAGGTFDSRYTQIGKTVIWFCKFTAGTGSTFSGVPAFSLPVTASTFSTDVGLGVSFYRITGNTSPGQVVLNNTTSVRFYANNAAGTYLTSTDVTGSIPFTWTAAATTTLAFTIVYQAA